MVFLEGIFLTCWTLLTALVLSSCTAMGGALLAKLKIFYQESNIQKWTLPHGITGVTGWPSQQGKDYFWVRGTTSDCNIWTQVLAIWILPLNYHSATETTSPSFSLESYDCVSLAPNDTIILSSPVYVSSGTQQWPTLSNSQFFIWHRAAAGEGEFWAPEWGLIPWIE